MKRWMLTSLLTLGWLLGMAQAYPEKSGMNSPLWPATWASYDTNGDGKLEDGEWKILREKNNEGDLYLWKRFDLNKDGQVDDEEIADARLDYERWAIKNQREYDRNHDGQLDDQERLEWRRSCPY
ncbi:MAG: EF-hand domain-containing protein [Vulcanimicrobiota bacterium]